MTRPEKKADEKRYVERFLEGIVDHVDIVEGERPDFHVTCRDGNRIAVEVTKYHPCPIDGEKYPRTETESCWWNDLWPEIDTARREETSLEQIHTFLVFNSEVLPAKGEHAEFAEQLVRLVSETANRISDESPEAKVYFVSQAMGGSEFQELGAIWIPAVIEEWPLLGKYMREVNVTHCPIPWALW